MTITLHDVSKNTVDLIDKAGIDHFEYGDRRILTRLEGIRGAHLSQNYLYLEGDSECAIIDNHLYSYLEMM